jgi:hypothetical protein
MAWLGRAWIGMAWQGFRDDRLMAWHGSARLGGAWRGRAGLGEGQDQGKAGRGKARLGAARCGVARQGAARPGLAGPGAARRGKAGLGEKRLKAGRGEARIGRAGPGGARHGTARQGLAWLGVAGIGSAGQGLETLQHTEALMGTIQIEFTGITPLLMHNADLADPFNPIVKQIAELTKKTRKTEEDHNNIAKLEWFGGLYTDATGVLEGIVMPTRNIRKCLIQTAKVTKQGTQIARALSFLALHVPFEYDGPKDLDDLYAIKKYQDRRPVRVSGIVQRMRANFPVWKVVAEANLLEDLMNPDDLQRIVALAGRIEGLGDARIMGFGRFEGRVRTL